MDINNQEDSSLPTSSFVEVAEDESQIVRDDETVRPSQPTSEMLQSTSDTLITLPNMENIVEKKFKSDSKASDHSETDFKVSLDNELSKENLEETIRLKTVDPEILSDNVSERMVVDENEDVVYNLDQVQDAFIFCPIIKSIDMDNIMAQGIFQSETEMSDGDERKRSFRHRLTEITFDKECYARDKFQTVEHVLNNMEINTNEEEFLDSLNVSGIFKFEKEVPINSWLDTNLESIRGATINLPVHINCN